jgi:hypothetical protein
MAVFLSLTCFVGHDCFCKDRQGQSQGQSPIFGQRDSFTEWSFCSDLLPTFPHCSDVVGERRNLDKPTREFDASKAGNCVKIMHTLFDTICVQPNQERVLRPRQQQTDSDSEPIAPIKAKAKANTAKTKPTKPKPTKPIKPIKATTKTKTKTETKATKTTGSDSPVCRLFCIFTVCFRG